MPSPLHYGDAAARQLAKFISSPVADATARDAIPLTDRVHGMLLLKEDDRTLWGYDENSSDSASSSVGVPADNPSTGRWLLLPQAGSTAASIFGDGSDGAAAFDGATTVAGHAPSSNVYTLTKDLFFSSITVSAGVTVKTAGFRLFCSGACTIIATGSIQCNGNAGGNGSAGTGGTAGAVTNASGALGVGTAGGAGGAGNNAGAAGTANAAGYPGGTGVGGAGGGDGTHTAAAAGVWTALAAVKGGARYMPALQLGMIFGSQTSGTASLISLICGGTGGGGGGGDNADAGGGGGGGGGGVLILSAATLVNGGSITATGGAGGNGVSAAHNAGGGGGGGGGVVITIARSRSGAGTVTAGGGAGGTKAGASGVIGSDGAAGVVVQASA